MSGGAVLGGVHCPERGFIPDVGGDFGPDPLLGTVKSAGLQKLLFHPGTLLFIWWLHFHMSTTSPVLHCSVCTADLKTFQVEMSSYS